MHFHQCDAAACCPVVGVGRVFFQGELRPGTKAWLSLGANQQVAVLAVPFVFKHAQKLVRNHADLVHDDPTELLTPYE